MESQGQAELKDTQSQWQSAEPLFGRTMNALTWRFASESLRFVLQLTVMIILARLIHVDQFGLLALAMVIITLFIRISEIGIYYAVVQRKDLTDTHIRVAFTLSTIFGVFFTGVVFITAPISASLLGNEEVAPILQLTSLIFFFMNLGSTAMGLLQRKLDYTRLLIVELGSYSVGNVMVSIALALMNYGVWALAWAAVIHMLLRTILLLFLSPHPKRPSLSAAEARQLLNFGIGSSLSTLANYAAINGDYFVVGRWLGTTALGLYSRAYQLMTLPMAQFTAVIASVLFPVYSMIQDEEARFRRAYLHSVSLSAMIVTPFLAILGIAAPEIMVGVFGQEWLGAAAPLTILCAGGFFHSAYSLGDSLARAKGAVYEKFRRHSIYAICVFAGSYIGSKWGINAVAFGVVVAVIIMYILMAELTIKLTRASWKVYLLCQVPGVIIAAAVVAISFPLTLLLRAANLPPLIILTCILITSAVAAIAAGFMIPRDWLNKNSFGAVDTIRQLADIFERRLRSYIRRRELLYKIAHAPFTWYETAVFLNHVHRQGLWNPLFGYRQSSLRQKHQKEIIWETPFPRCSRSTDLVDWLRSQNVQVSEGAHTIYVPPQKRLDDLIPQITNFYPRGAGFKIIKNFGRPSEARYLVKKDEAYIFLHRLIGTPQNQIVVANYAYSLGISPRIWDLTCWKTPENHYTVFVVDDAGSEHPSTEQCLSFLGYLKRIDANSHLRIVIPNWEKGDDFLPPDCHNNLRYSRQNGLSQYVDFQNFCLTSFDAWSKEILANSNGDLRWGRSVAFEKETRTIPGRHLGNVNSRLESIKGLFAHASVSLIGRIVLSVGNDSGMTVYWSSTEGAAWSFGWTQPSKATLVRDFLLSLGITRFTISGGNIGPECKLEDHIPARFQSLLNESVIFYRPHNDETGLSAGLQTIPWRVIVYEGRESDQIEDINKALKQLLGVAGKARASSFILSDNGRRLPIVMLLRH